MVSMLEQYVNKTLNTRRIITFDNILVEQHIGIPHPIMIIPAKYTLLDALCYVYDDDVVAIAKVLQGYQDGLEHAHDIMEALEEGIKSKCICLTCVKDSVNYLYKGRGR